MEFLLNGHEINLKGGNRGFFATRLRANLQCLLAGTEATVTPRGRGYLVQCAPAQAANVRTRLDRALGIQTIVAGERTPPTIAAIAAAAQAVIAAQTGPTFALAVRRPDKQLALASQQVADEVGRHIAQTLGLRVDLDEPARRCTVVLSRAGALVSRAREAGLGGMPAGTAGRFLALLSTGFDSPVAAYRLIRRGGQVGLLHFHAPARRSGGDSAEVAAGLARQLTRYQLHSRLYLCPFAPVQQAVVAAARAELRVLLYRRMMLRIAAALGARTGCQGLVTGDSLAQVASQTARNLAAVEAALGGALPVYRPLIGDDKVTIQREARLVGTYEWSSEQTDDCCSAYLPQHPALASSAGELARAEEALDVPALVEQSLAALETRRFRLVEGVPVELAAAPLAAAAD